MSASEGEDTGSDGEVETLAGRSTKVIRDNVSEAAAQAVGMGLFIGLLLLTGVLLLLREADLVAFDIPNALLALFVLVALVVGSSMDTSIVPDE
jgi:hypothetical protein